MFKCLNIPLFKHENNEYIFQYLFNHHHMLNTVLDPWDTLQCSFSLKKQFLVSYYIQMRLRTVKEKCDSF